MDIRALWFSAGLVAVVLGACSSGGGGDSATPSTQAGAPAATAAEGSGGVTPARCAETAAAMAKAATATGAAFSGSTAEYQQSIDQMQAFAAAAPREIRDDMKIVADGYTTVVRALADANFNPASGQPPSSAAIQRLQQASNSLDETRFTDAANRVSAWFQNRCGR